MNTEQRAAQKTQRWRRRFVIAQRASVVRRALRYAIVVGAILIAINHGNAILAGAVDSSRIVQMILTVFVPYTVSTLSSVDALIAQENGA